MNANPPVIPQPIYYQRSDAGWKDVAIRRLHGDQWVSSEIVSYLDSLGLPETRAALDRFADGARVAKKGLRGVEADGELYTLRKIEELRVGERLGGVPVR